MVHGIKRKKERERETEGRNTDTRHGKVEEKGRRGGRLETEETEERALSLATRSRTPVPTQHGTASHNRWKGNEGERQRERERHTGRRGREEDERERERERERQIDRRRERPPLDPESANSNITIRPPRSKRRRASRLPPSSYVFSSLALSLSSPFYSTYLFLARSRSCLPRTPAPNLSLLSPPPSFLCASLPPLSSPQPPSLRGAVVAFPL